MAALEATESYGEVVLDEGQEDRDEMGVLDELGEEIEGNGDRGEDDNEEDD